MERLRRWGRRNPAIASLTGAIALLLILITVLTLRANARLEQKATDLSTALGTAETNRVLAEEKRGEAEKATKTALNREYEAYLALLRAGRFSGRPLQRFEGSQGLHRGVDSRKRFFQPVRKTSIIREEKDQKSEGE